jgi:hypothetical protein
MTVKLRQYIIFFLAFLFVLNAGSKLVIYADFYLNREYIAENLCENKEEPELQCNGKCHLMKTLKQEEEKQPEDQQNTPKKVVDYQLFADKVFYASDLQSDILLEPSSESHFLYQNNYSHLSLSSLFRPPIG